MARYWVTGVHCQANDPAASFAVNADCSYVGSDVQDGQSEQVISFEVLFSDTPANIRTKLTDAVVIGAASVPNASEGLGVTVVRSQGLIPTFQVGA